MLDTPGSSSGRVASYNCYTNSIPVPTYDGEDIVCRLVDDARIANMEIIN